VNPSYSGWRSALAVELAADDRDEAIRLAHENVGHARRTGVARGLGVTLRAQGAIEGSADALREAAALLERSPARLEEARALVDLGAVLRRRGRRTEARDALRDGLDLARRCGADRLADRARDELGASGARLRREAASGVESLTPGERRVALLAAQSLSNAEIAQALFVTVNTVQTHLSHVYAKLEITSRAQLAAALAEIITGSQ
jgi:DNA-binding CsgD family transcriptional regulator